MCMRSNERIRSVIPTYVRFVYNNLYMYIYIYIVFVFIIICLYNA